MYTRIYTNNGLNTVAYGYTQTGVVVNQWDRNHEKGFKRMCFIVFLGN